MSDIDKMMQFQKGLLTEVKQEVKLRQFRTTTDAIPFALMYDRTHGVSSRHHGRQGLQSVQRRSYRSYPQPRQHMEEQPTPMEIGNARFVSHEECMRRNLSNQSWFRRVVDDEDGSGDDEDDLVEDSDAHVEVLDSLQLNMVSVNGEASSKRELLRFEGLMNGQVVRVLIDSGAERNIVRPGLAQHYVDAAKVTAEPFDGSTTPARMAQCCCESLSRSFKDVSLIEWEVSENQDVILGHPWLVQFNSIINWQTGWLDVTSDFLQPLPAKLGQQLDVHVQAGYFHMPLGPRSIEARGCQPLPIVFDNRDDDDADTSLVGLSAARFATKVQADVYAELYHGKIKASPKVKTIPPQLQTVVQEFADVFPVELPPGLPPNRSIEHDVVLKSGAKPSNRAPIRLSKVEQDALDIFAAELLKKKWIEISDSPWVSNIFGVPKKDPSICKFPSRLEWLHSNNPHMPIRWVIDYRLVNTASEVTKIPLPNNEQPFDRMNVAPMGLAGMPGTWPRLMRKVLSHLAFVVVYLDDICIFSRSMADHVTHLRQVGEVLREHKLYARPDKCDFGQSFVDLLGRTISVNGLHVDARKPRANAEWKGSGNMKDLQRFLGLACYYRQFIHSFATLVLPLGALVKKDVTWIWDKPQRQAFNFIKLALQHAPVLQLPDLGKSFIVTTDASHTCIGGVLSQMHGGSELPVAFFSKNLGAHELNWPVHEKELFAIKQALTRWRHYLHGVSFEVYTDNSACKWFLQHPRLSGRLARWLGFFASFQVTLHHRPGALNVVADALSRPPGSSSSPGEGQ
ncbi:unnamed protein product [Phytophthora fragariaefolia]|uniref:RNA-directed DNA polymerase n=1 Tax=Phytophthora fragariaefolia TaxID=1490495 RepID=A0A9W7CJK5_9STRA|nr:unnamed protein product [Phytophthora fragariaefolia]